MAKDNAMMIVTGPITVRWADVVTPSYRYASQQDPRGTFQVECIFDPETEADSDILKRMSEFWASEYELWCRRENKKKLPTHDKPWKEVLDDNGEPTGLVSMRPKNKESFKGKDGIVKVEIPQYDASGKRIKQVEIGNGSTCRVKMLVSSFYTAGKFGLQNRLKSIQVIDLIEYDPTGFGEYEHGGWEGEEYVRPEPEQGDEGPAPEPDDLRQYTMAPPPPDNWAADQDNLELPL